MSRWRITAEVEQFTADENPYSALVPVVVEANSLHEALAQAMTVPFANWFPKEDDDE